MKRPLSWLIDRFAMLAAGEDLRLTVPAEQAAQLRDLLRELRARRIAMKREPDDERNAPRDMCSCVVGHSGKRRAPTLWGTERAPFRDGCPLHPRPRDCDGEPAPDCPVGGSRVCPIPPACTCELVDSSRDELPDGGPCPLSGWVAPRPGDGCPVHRDDELHGPRLRCGAFRLRDCGGVSECDPLCEPAEEAFPF